MNIEHISISRSQTFDSCKQNYKYRYHLKTVSPEPEPPFFNFGKIVHKIIEIHTLSKGKKNLQEIITDVTNGNIFLEDAVYNEQNQLVKEGKKADILSTEYKNKLIRMIKHYSTYSQRIGFEGQVEWKFDIDMDGKGRKMTGFIDRLIEKDGKYYIIDYKTTKPGKFRKDVNTIKKDLQLQTYAYVVASKLGIDPDKIKCFLFYLDDNKIIPAQYSSSVVYNVPNILLSKFIEIENTNPDTVVGNVSFSCNFCVYKSICPFKSFESRSIHR